MEWQDIIFKFVGGLGIFLFGIKYMSDGLQKTAGDKMRSLLETYTSNPFMGVLVGIVVTILLQTSTGTTVMANGLVKAGLMTLRQAIGVIMGANIGTTLTALNIGIKIEEYALPIIALGAFLLFFIRKKMYQYYGQVPAQNEFMRPKGVMEFGAIDVEGCANDDAQSFSLNPFYFNLQMPDNTRSESTMPAAEPELNHTELAPGECVRGYVTFEVPQGQTPIAIYFKPMGGESSRAPA
jgi:hypothetical protein